MPRKGLEPSCLAAPAPTTMDVSARLAAHSKYAVELVLGSLSSQNSFGMTAVSIASSKHEETMKRLDTASMKIARLKKEAEQYDKGTN